METNRRAPSRIFDSPTGRFSVTLRGRSITDPLPWPFVPLASADVVGGAIVRLQIYCGAARPYFAFEVPLEEQHEGLRRFFDSTFSTPPIRRGAFLIGHVDDLEEFLTQSVTSFHDYADSFSAPDDAVQRVSVDAIVTLRVPESAWSSTFDLSRRLQGFRKVTYRHERDDDEVEMIREESCPICLKDYGVGEQLHLTPCCRHPFHMQCLLSCLQLKAACPLCRRLVT